MLLSCGMQPDQLPALSETPDRTDLLLLLTTSAVHVVTSPYRGTWTLYQGSTGYTDRRGITGTCSLLVYERNISFGTLYRGHAAKGHNML